MNPRGAAQKGRAQERTVGAGAGASENTQLDSLRVVLVGTRNPLNIGAAARAMSNFGVSHLRLVKPYDLAFREARSAVGAAKLLARAEEYESVAEAVADCALVVGTTVAGGREMQHPLRRLEYGARVLRKQLASGRIALLFGSEKFGLSRDDMSHCHWLMRIPTREKHGAMNLGQAVAVCLYELVRGRGAEAKPEKRQRATAGQQERVISVLLEALLASGYTNSAAAAATAEKVRRVVRRLSLQGADAEALTGMLRQVLWKLGAGRDEEP